MHHLTLSCLSGLVLVLAACDAAPRATEPAGDAAPAALAQAEPAAEPAAEAPAPSEPPAEPAPEPASDPAPDAAPDPDAPGAEALHALLLASEDMVIPSDWTTGEPAPETALTYWMVPEIDVDAERTATCAPAEDAPEARICELSMTSRPVAGENRQVTARFRMTVTTDEAGALVLASPNVPWAVTG